MRVPKDIALMMGSIRSIMEDLEPEDLADGIALHNDATEQVMVKVWIVINIVAYLAFHLI